MTRATKQPTWIRNVVLRQTTRAYLNGEARAHVLNRRTSGTALCGMVAPWPLPKIEDDTTVCQRCASIVKIVDAEYRKVFA